jgi:Fibronectin type III domain
MSTKTKQKVIKAIVNFRRMGPEIVVSTSDAIQAHFDKNPNATAPLPVDLPTVKSATDLLRQKITAAAEGGKTAVSEKNDQKQVVAGLLEQLAHYAEANSKGDLTTFLSFGFTPKASTKKKTAPASESIRKIVPGKKSGEFEASLMPFPDAGSYEVQWAPVGAGGAPGAWTSKAFTNIKHAVLITGFTPGTTYVFQARAVTNTGHSDWSESITRIAQ